MPFVGLGELDLGGCLDVIPPVDARARCGGPDVFSSSNDLVDTLMLLADCDGQTFVHLSTIAHIALGDETRAVRRVEDGELWIFGEQRPDAVVVHGERVHAATSRHGPHLDRLVGGARENGVAILRNEDIAHIVRVADKLCDALSCARVPNADDALWAAAGNDAGRHSEGVDGALGGVLVLAHGNLELLARAIEVPQADLAIQSTRGYPRLAATGRGDPLDIVGMEAYGLGRKGIGGSGAPDLDGDVGRGRDEGSRVLGEDDVVDPVGVGLDLLAELGGWGLVVCGIRVGEGVALGGGVGEVEVQVPGADDAVAAARVAAGCE